MTTHIIEIFPYRSSSQWSICEAATKALIPLLLKGEVPTGKKALIDDLYNYVYTYGSKENPSIRIYSHNNYRISWEEGTYTPYKSFVSLIEDVCDRGLKNAQEQSDIDAQKNIIACLIKLENLHPGSFKPTLDHLIDRHKLLDSLPLSLRADVCDLDLKEAQRKNDTEAQENIIAKFNTACNSGLQAAQKKNNIAAQKKYYSLSYKARKISPWQLLA